MTPLVARRAASRVLAAGVFSCSVASAQADPAVDFAAGAPAYEAAAQIARDQWQGNPCGGQIAIVWMGLSESTNATSTWTNPVGQYDAPDQNGTCQIAFNKTLAWDWTRFCSILVHEYGHLAGRAHADDRADVMYAYYEAPVAQCAAAAPASAPVQPAATVPAAAPAVNRASSTRPRWVSAGRSVKRGTLVLVKRHRLGTRRAGRHGGG